MSYRGMVAAIPLGEGGLVGTKNITELKPFDLMDTNNIAYSEGTITKEGGATQFVTGNALGGSQVFAGHDFWVTPALRRTIVVLSSGLMLKDSGSGAFSGDQDVALNTTGYDGLFVEGGSESISANKKLFYFNGLDQVQVQSGDAGSAVAIATPPADWTTTKPKTGCIHGSRLWGFAQHRAYYSLITDHEDFTTSGAGQMAVYPGEGEEIVASISFRGLLFVFKKPRGIYIIDSRDIDPTNWSVKRYTRHVGIAGPNALAEIDNDVAFMDETGTVHLLSAAQEFGDVLASAFSEQANLSPFLRANLNLSAIGRTRALYYPAKRELHFAVPGLGSSVNNRRLVADLNLPGRPRWRWSDRDVPVSMWLRRDTDGIERPVHGTDDGQIYFMDRSVKSKNGQAYTSSFQTAYTDFSHLDPKLASVRKNFEFIEIVVEPQGNWSLTLDVYIDGRFSQTLQFQLGTLGAALGSFVLDTDALGGGRVLNKRRRLYGSGRRVSFIVKNSGAGNDFSIARIYVHFVPGDEREAS